MSNERRTREETRSCCCAIDFKSRRVDKSGEAASIFLSPSLSLFLCFSIVVENERDNRNESVK